VGGIELMRPGDEEVVRRVLQEARFAATDQERFDEIDLAFNRILRGREDYELRELLARWITGSEPNGDGSLLMHDTLAALGQSPTEGDIGLVLVLTTKPERAGLKDEAKAAVLLPRPLAEDLDQLQLAIGKMVGPQLVTAMVGLLGEDRCPSCGGSFGGYGYLPNNGRKGDCEEPRHR
jgi:hypothetical protein